ncbi:hypothetical protein ON010_g5661 [Phytophthora cinnamomi]|nr:hypothetical protein ON010_g5661 [Phytophthora cinnamomi]
MLVAEPSTTETLAPVGGFYTEAEVAQVASRDSHRRKADILTISLRYQPVVNFVVDAHPGPSSDDSNTKMRPCQQATADRTEPHRDIETALSRSGHFRTEPNVSYGYFYFKTNLRKMRWSTLTQLVPMT